MLYLDSELRGPNIHTALVFTMISNLKLFSVPLCDPIDGSPPGSPVPGILQARAGSAARVG